METNNNNIDETYQRVCSYEAVKMSLEAIKDYLPILNKVKTPSGEADLTEEVRQEYNNQINNALSTLSNIQRTEFDIELMFKEGHAEILLNCLEFYGEFLHSTLTYIGNMYRQSYKQKFGQFPEETIQQQENLTP